MDIGSPMAYCFVRRPSPMEVDPEVNMTRTLSVQEFAARKAACLPISMVTCYDHWSARLLAATDVDCLLVGDSVAMVMHGHDSTIHADLDMMALHTEAVSRGAGGKFIVTDMPFLAHRAGTPAAMAAVGRLVQAGAMAVKIEGAAGNLELIRHIVESGVPVMGHLGLTPQSHLVLGGHRVQGRDEQVAASILASAGQLASAGCFALVLECVPDTLAERVTQSVGIPTIGIGAGSGTDGQVLVLHDLLAVNETFHPRFVRQYGEGHRWVREAVDAFHRDVVSRRFPGPAETFS